MYYYKSLPAAKLVCVAETGLAHSLSLSVTSGEAKPTRPLYTLVMRRNTNTHKIITERIMDFYRTKKVVYDNTIDL